jgi:hypothetical protein
MNISRAGKLKHAEADRTKVQLMAAMPYSDKNIIPVYVFITPHSMASYQYDQAGSATGSTAGHGPFTCGSDAHGHGQQSPFAMLRSLTSVTLHQYPLAYLPARYAHTAVCTHLHHCLTILHLDMFTDALLLCTLAMIAELRPCRILLHKQHCQK